MGGNQGKRARAFIDLPAFDANASVLHHVDSTKARGARSTAYFIDDVRDRKGLVVDGDWHAGDK